MFLQLHAGTLLTRLSVHASPGLYHDIFSSPYVHTNSLVTHVSCFNSKPCLNIAILICILQLVKLKQFLLSTRVIYEFEKCFFFNRGSLLALLPRSDATCLLEGRGGKEKEGRGTVLLILCSCISPDPRYFFTTFKRMWPNNIICYYSYILIGLFLLSIRGETYRWIH